MPTTPTEQNTNTNKVFDYALEFYTLMQNDAVQMDVDGTQLPTYEGSLTKSFALLKVSMSYYTPITRFLKDSGCISVIKRGARNTLSLVVLHHEPTEEGWKDYQDNFQTKQATRGTDVANLQASIRELEDWRKTVLNFEAVAKNFEDRISKLEIQTQINKQGEK